MSRKILPLTYLTMLFLAFAAKPTFANEPMYYGLYTSVTPAAISKTTWGIAAVLIIAIESLFFKRYWDYTWRTAILFTIGINLCSTFIGGFLADEMFASEYFYQPLMIGMPIVFSVLLIRHKPPGWFYILTLLLFILGSIRLVPDSKAFDPMPKALLLAYIELPLVMGFALTLWIESLVIRNKSMKYEFWKVIVKANAASYLLLLFLFPFFAPNPYSMQTGEKWLKRAIFNSSESIEKPGNIERTIEFLHKRRASTPQLLGLIDTEKPPMNYSADFEIGFLEDLSSSISVYNPKDLKTIIEDTLKLSTLKPDAKEKLRWLEQFFSFLAQVSEMIDNSDQTGLNKVYTDWVVWQEKTEYPGTVSDHLTTRAKHNASLRILGDFPHPSYMIGGWIELKKSKLILPEKSNVVSPM